MTKQIKLFIAAAVISVGCAFLMRFHVVAPPAPLTGNPIVREQYWESRIRAIGPTRGYDEFARDVSALSPAQQHDNAHAFGGALFSIEGVGGLSTCDARFSYGCYHEFLGRAIASLGLSVVDALNQGCIDDMGQNALSCQHGIGHGIEAALGYSDVALRKALVTCSELPHGDPIGGCYGGVFMEYNMQTMLGEQAQTRPEKAGDPLYPCDTLSSTYTAACYFWSPQWWINLQHQAYGRDHFNASKIGVLCDSVHSREMVRHCYEGLGTIIAPEANFNPAQAAVLCEDASTDPIHQLYCKSYAANSLTVGGSGQQGDGLGVCKGLTGNRYEYCAAYASNHANLTAEMAITDL